MAIRIPTGAARCQYSVWGPTTTPLSVRYPAPCSPTSCQPSPGDLGRQPQHSGYARPVTPPRTPGAASSHSTTAQQYPDRCQHPGRPTPNALWPRPSRGRPTVPPAPAALGGGHRRQSDPAGECAELRGVRDPRAYLAEMIMTNMQAAQKLPYMTRTFWTKEKPLRVEPPIWAASWSPQAGGPGASTPSTKSAPSEDQTTKWHCLHIGGHRFHATALHYSLT